MVNNSSKNINPFSFNGKIIDAVNGDKRRIVHQLPMINQTQTLQKFFGASGDHLFNPGKAVPMNGFIGDRPIYWDRESEYYIEENDSDRNFYQLVPSMISKNKNGEVTNVLFYLDLLNQLRFQGGITNNHTRLFNQNYYTWCPPIDIDKFNNFREYVWVPMGPTPIKLYGHRNRTVADGTTNEFNLAEYNNTLDTTKVKVFINDVEYTNFNLNIDETKVILNDNPIENSIVDTFIPSDIKNDLSDVATYTYGDFDTLSSGTRIEVLNDIDTTLNGEIYIVEGVGTNIFLLADLSPKPNNDVDYITIERGSKNRNEWSTSNRWFHKSIVSDILDDSNNVIASRPIIEFERDLELYNYGQVRRNDVHLVSDNIDNFIDTVNGSTEIINGIDGTVVDIISVNNMPNGELFVLVIGDKNETVNNRVYKIIVENGVLQTGLISTGIDPTGEPTFDEVIYVADGSVYGNRNVNYNGSAWVISQQRNAKNQAPLFNLYDYNGNSLSDNNRYPLNNFSGSKLFGYDLNDNSSKVDSILGFKLVYNSTGDIVFENYISTERYTYKIGSSEYNIDGYYFHNNNGILNNDWYNTFDETKQYVIDTFVAKSDVKTLTLSQAPVDKNHIDVTKNGINLVQDVDYFNQNNKILINNVIKDDIIVARTYNPDNMSINSKGKYEIPLNLQANPSWNEVITISKNELFDHFSSIIRNQDNFEGNDFSNNNYRDSKKEKNKGKYILQHSAPILRTMLLSSSSDIDVILSMRFANSEYNRFKSKLIQKITEYLIDGKLTSNDLPSTWTKLALDELNIGLTSNSPFYYSGMGVNSTNTTRYCIPSTPSYLGVYQVYTPRIELDTSLNPPQNVIIGHDGSKMPVFGDFRDTVILDFETKIYNSINQNLRTPRPVYDYINNVSGKFRKGSYSISEFNMLLSPIFERWVSSNGIDYKTNKSFDINDPFTWNWSSVRDMDGNPVPGHYRGIYQYYFDTDQPHTKPWEMLGFTNKPSWWELRYGSAPYTSNNTMLWDDLENGRIFSGSRQTASDPVWARPNLKKYIPVDEQGNLLNPYECGIVRNNPTPTNAQKDWTFGDISPVEAAWMRSSEYPFAISQALYLMKPSSFIENTWDTVNRKVINKGKINEQFINIATGNRMPLSSDVVHTEIGLDNQIITKIGSQQWIVDYLIGNNKNVTSNLGNLIRGADVQLSYKIGGFTDSGQLKVYSDNIGLIQGENIGVSLYKSPSVSEEIYSGVIIEYTGQHWKIYGYDVVDPTFKIYNPDKNGNKITISTDIAKNKISVSWKSNTYYTVYTTIKYDNKYYSCIRTHTSSNSFEEEYWRQVARPDFANTMAVEYYTEHSTTTIDKIPYGTIIKTPQDLANFISGYEKYLISRGWIFDELITDDNPIANWRLVVKRFLNWIVNDDLVEGSLISLSPSKFSVKFNAPHGTIQPVEQIINGVYSILDKSGRPINPEQTNIVRYDDNINIMTVDNQEIYALRLFISEVEQIMLFDNTTLFGELMYSPLLNIKQPRLRLQGYKTSEWTGRMDAPGFIVTSNTIYPNFEKTADDFRRMFDIETVENNSLQQHAKANTGYSEKEYLNNLLLSPTNQYEFYQGMIQQKGTISAFRKLLRSNFIRHSYSMDFLEEWAFRLDNYGFSRSTPSFDISINQSDVVNNPQLFKTKSRQLEEWSEWDGLIPSGNIVKRISVNGISNVVVTDGGSGYKSIPEIDAGNGSVLKVNMDWSESHITSINVLSGGNGFLPNDRLEIIGSGNDAIAIVDGVDLTYSRINDVIVETTGGIGAGSGYNINDMIVSDDGDGNAKLRVSKIDNFGGILELVVVDGGYGYPSNPVLYASNGNNTAIPYIKALVSGGPITSISLISGGNGYDDKSYIVFSGNGTGAICDVVISGGSIDSVDILNSGSGFITSPSLVISGGSPTSPATLSAIVDTSPLQNVINVAKFITEKGVLIKNINIKVETSFNGVQPSIKIGDSDNNERYVSTYNIGSVKNKTFNFNISTPVYNEYNEINAYIENTNNIGNLIIVINYELTEDYYSNQTNNINEDGSIIINDVFYNNDFVLKDKKWVIRYDTEESKWPTRYYENKEKGTLPNAGYVSLEDVKWTSKNKEEFLNIYRELQDVNPSQQVINSVVITYENNLSAVPQIKRIPIIPNINKGKYRFRNINVDVQTDFSVLGNNKPTISIGSFDNPTKYMSVTDVDITNIQEFNKKIYDFIDVVDGMNNGIFVYYDQKSNLNIGLGELSIEIEMELMNEYSIQPNQRLWCYDVDYGKWDVFRFGDTGINVVSSYLNSFPEQGTPIVLNKNIFDAMGINYNINNISAACEEAEKRLNMVIIDGSSSVDSNLMGYMKAKLKNQVKLFLDTNDNLINNGNIKTQFLLTELWNDMGIVIDKITVSVVKPFVSPNGRNPTLTIGTLGDSSKYVNSVSHMNNSQLDELVKPSFVYGNPIEVNIFDEQIKIGEALPSTNVNVRLVRDGNIYATPSSINVINGGYGYSETSNPNISITGPIGVKASANITGTIVGFRIVNPGTGYSSSPDITIMGGNGTGAVAQAHVSGGNITSITIPGAGSGSVANPIMSGGKVVGYNIISSGSGWSTTPIIKLNGGNPSNHAACRAILNGSGGVSSIIIDNGGENYSYAPTVEFLANTGKDYTSVPRIIISGGGGTGAIIEPVMMWRIDSINIDDWGKCSWLGNAIAPSNVVIESPNGGASAVAIVNQEPSTISPTIIRQWRYKVVSPVDHPNYNIWNNVGNASTNTIVFPAPNSTNSPDYWTQNITLSLPPVTEETIYEIEIPEYVYDASGNITSTANVINGFVGDNNTSVVTIMNSVGGIKDIDLTVVGSKTFNINELITENADLVAFFNADGTNGLVNIVVDYHYTTGIEVFDLQDIPLTTSVEQIGGDLFNINSVRFGSIEELDNPNRKPPNGWNNADIVFVDDGRDFTQKSRNWDNTTLYKYHELIRTNNKIYRSIKSGSGTEVTGIVSSGSLSSIVFDNVGQMYTTDPIIYINGNGTGASAHSVLHETSIYKINVLNGGSGYTGNEAIEITPKYGNGSGAYAQIGEVSASGSIKSILLISTGENYDSAPIINIANDTNVGPDKATFEAIMEPSFMKNIIIDNGGSGYSIINIGVQTTEATVGTFVEDEWEIASEERKVWRTFNRYNNIWFVDKEQTKKVESDKISKAVIYNRDKNTTEQYIQLFDPAKGLIPSSARKELSYIIEYDPASYNVGTEGIHTINANDTWGINQVGQLWWDLSTTKYLDYEIGSTEYKWRNWGKLCPNTTIDVYEWVRTTIHPYDWSEAVENNINSTEYVPTGIVKNIDTVPAWVQSSEFNFERGVQEEIYYYWVKNVSKLSPDLTNRTITCLEVSSIIQDPTSNNIPWFAVIDEDAFIVGNINSYVNSNNAIFKLDWKLGNEEGNNHKQWTIIRKGDSQRYIENSIWEKMSDSIIGWNTYIENKTTVAYISNNVTSGSSTLILDDASNLDDIGEINIDGKWFSYGWKYNNTLYDIMITDDYAAGTKITQNKSIHVNKRVPGKWLTDEESYGSLIRPSQTWFKYDTDVYGTKIPSRNSRKTLVDKLNDIFSKEPFLDSRIDMIDIFDAYDEEPMSSLYNIKVENMEYRNRLVTFNNITKGQTVLVSGNIDTDNFWTLWKYDPENPSSDINGFILIDAQKWSLQDDVLWEKIDWYADGWSSNNYPVKTFNTVAERDMIGKLDVSLLDGTLVKVLSQNNTDNRWSWSLYTENGWIDVAKEKSTVKLKDQYYTSTVQYATNDIDISKITVRDGTNELKWILDNIKSSVLTGEERNDLFFTMVNSAHSQHKFVDWSFKTSFLYLSGYSELLTQKPVAFKDQVDNLIKYIEDVKPYHVKIRDYVRRLSTPIDNMNVNLTDFDKPMYYDITLNGGSGGWRRLNPKNAADQIILSTTPIYKDWWNNYLKTNYDKNNWDANWNPIRKMNITMLLDRVSCSYMDDVNGVDVGGSANRIENFYDPQSNMKRKNIKELTSGCEFKGTVMEGHQYSMGLWDVFPWDSCGWEDEFAYYIGYDNQINPLLTGPASYSKMENSWRMDDKGREYLLTNSGIIYRNGPNDYRSVDENGNIVNNLESYDIAIEGNDFVQPYIDENHPEELISTRMRYPLMVTVYQKQDNNSIPSNNKNNTFRIFKDSNGFWETKYIEDQGITLANNVSYDDRSVIVNIPAGSTIFDPENPDDKLFDKLNPKYVYHYTDGTMKNTSTGIWNIQYDIEDLLKIYSSEDTNSLDNDRIFDMMNEIFSINSVVWIKADLKFGINTDVDGDIQNDSGKMKGTVSNITRTTGTNDIISIDIDISNVVVTGAAVHWSIIPHFLVKHLGSVWINNEKMTYSHIEENIDEDNNVVPYQYILKNVARGVGGTSYAKSLKLDTVYHSGDDIETRFSVPPSWSGDATKLRVFTLSFDSNDNPQKWMEKSFTVDYTIDGNDVVFNNAPISSINTLYDNIRIDVIVSDWYDDVPTHIQGDRVFDVGPLQTLDMNMTYFNSFASSTDGEYIKIMDKWFSEMNDVDTKPGPDNS